MIPYTPETVDTIRERVKSGVPADYVRQSLGWDAEMFERICRRHAIDCPAVIAPPVAPAPTPMVRGPTNSIAENAREDVRTIKRAHQPVWRTVHVSRKAHRLASDEARNARVSFAAALSTIIEASLMSGEAETVYLLERGDVKRDIYCNLRLMPGVDVKLQEICQARRVPPTVLLASILEHQVKVAGGS